MDVHSLACLRLQRGLSNLRGVVYFERDQFLELADEHLCVGRQQDLDKHHMDDNL